MTTIRRALVAYRRRITRDAQALPRRHEDTKTDRGFRGLRGFVPSWPHCRPATVSCLLLCAVALLGVRVEATTLVAADAGELARDAGAIVRGRVTATTVQWTGDRRSIETVVTLATEASLKGSLGASVQFAVPGGSLGRYRRILVGAPEFIVGQHVVVFLGWRAPRVPYLLGLGQGVFRVDADRDRGWLVTPPPRVAPPTGTIDIVRGDPARRPMALADFEQRIRELAGGQR